MGCGAHRSVLLGISLEGALYKAVTDWLTHRFGGSNSHLVLDDALNFLAIHGLKGHHYTTDHDSQTSDQMCKGTNSDSSHNEELSLCKNCRTQKLLVWSAADKNGIGRLKDAWGNYFSTFDVSKQRLDTYLANLAYTLGGRRTHFPWRTFTVANSTGSLTRQAESFSPARKAHQSPNLALVFSGVCTMRYTAFDLLGIADHDVARSSMACNGP